MTPYHDLIGKLVENRGNAPRTACLQGEPELLLVPHDAEGWKSTELVAGPGVAPGSTRLMRPRGSLTDLPASRTWCANPAKRSDARQNGGPPGPRSPNLPVKNRPLCLLS